MSNFSARFMNGKMDKIEISGTNILSPNCKSHASAKEFLDEFLKKTTVTSLLLDKNICLHLCIFQTKKDANIYSKQGNPAGTPGYRNGTESFFGVKGRPSVVRDVEIHNQPVLRMRRK